jgi:hypothetical protein
MLDELGPKFFGIRIEVIREPLRHQKPEDVRAEDQRPMIVEGPVNRRYDWMEGDVGYELTVVLRTGLDRLDRADGGSFRIPGPL